MRSQEAMPTERDHGPPFENMISGFSRSSMARAWNMPIEEYLRGKDTRKLEGGKPKEAYSLFLCFLLLKRAPSSEPKIVNLEFLVLMNERNNREYVASSASAHECYF
jgi:hypothetical protein